MFRIALVAALAATLCACATTEESIAVPYAAQVSQAVPGAESIRVTVTASDARTTNRARISTKLNGYGMEMAPIHAAVPVEETVRKALSDELKARGYVLSAGGVTINAAVDTFYNQYKIGMLEGKAAAVVDLTITVKDTVGGELYTRKINGVNSKGVQLASGANAADSIGKALQAALTTLFTDAAFTRALTGEAASGSTPGS